MHIRTRTAATPMHPYVQVNANASKYDSDLPHAQYERNLAFNEQTWPAATPKHPYVQVNANEYNSDLPYAQDERNLVFNE